MTVWLVLAIVVHFLIALTLQHYHSDQSVLTTTRTLPLRLVNHTATFANKPAAQKPAQSATRQPQPPREQPARQKQRPKAETKPHKPIKSQPARARTRPHPVPTPKKVDHPISPPHHTAVAPQPIPASSAKVAARPVTPPANPLHDQLTANYQALVRSGIEKNRHYPRRDRRQRNQGISVVEFTIAQDGSINGIHITSSSGHPSLDRATIQAVKGIDGNFPIPSKLGRQSWTFSIPVVYRLHY